MKLTFSLRYCVLFSNLFLGSLFLRPENKVALFNARVNENIVEGTVYETRQTSMG